MSIRSFIYHLVYKVTPDFILDPIRPIAGVILNRIKYSRKFYEEDYHAQEYDLQNQSLETVMERFEGVGDRLFKTLEQIEDLPAPETWLEVGCQFGKSAFWLAKRFPTTTFYMFDFAQAAIDFINKYNPIPEQTMVWRGDATDICYEGNRFDNFFDFISILDFTEHLPKPVYKGTIQEAFRVLKPSGYLLLKQGNTIRPEHINIRWEWQLIRDFEKAGFKLERRLPYRHYLMSKPLPKDISCMTSTCLSNFAGR